MGILASDSEDKSLHSPRQFLNASRTATPIGGRRFEDTTTIANLHLKSDAHVPPSLSPASEINPIQPPGFKVLAYRREGSRKGSFILPCYYVCVDGTSYNI